jgi:hypothetical protein
MMLTGTRSSGGACSANGRTLGAGARTTGVARGVLILIEPAC